MRKKKYIYNKQTLRYEEYKVSTKQRLSRILGLFSALLVSAAGLAILIDMYLPSQKEKALMRELEEMTYQYGIITDQLDLMSSELAQIQERDAKVHRFVFDMEPIEPSIWAAGVGGSEAYPNLSTYRIGGKTMLDTRRKIDKLARQLNIQKSSLDTLEIKAFARAERLKAIPSIKPVRVDLLKYNVTMLSGYGMRVHPIHKVKKMHTGIDFTAPKGSAIQATGNGRVVEVKQTKSGYGRHVVIDHGYGYESLYGHMDEIHVQVGDLVEKGQQIGTVGSTGTSTAPHCHYEIHYKKKAVDPIHFCLDGLTPEQYKEIVDRASSAKQSFD